jgi:LacI family transcriptional regulator
MAARRGPDQGKAEAGARRAPQLVVVGPGPVTLRTLARHLGLSVTTVSRAMKNANDVRPATIERVQQAAKTLGYRPHLGGIYLKTGRTSTVAMLLPIERRGEINSFGTALFEGIAAKLQASGYRLTVAPRLPADDALEVLKDLVAGRSIDGIILNNTRPQDDRVKFLLEAGIPFVTFGRTELFSPHPFVDIDHEAIGLAAVRLLAEAGHRRVALVAPPEPATYSQQFARGWRLGLAELGWPAAHGPVLFAPITPDAGQRVAHELLRQAPDVTGAFMGSELAALGFVSGLLAQGRAVGRDFGLISYGGSRLHTFLNPPLSAFIHPHAAIGGRVAALLVRAIAGEPAASLQEIVQAEFVDLRSQRRS